MADNVPITAGTGTNIATDEIGGVHYQRTKATFGADGSATDVSASNPFPTTMDAGTLLNRLEQILIVLRQLMAGAAGQLHDGTGRTRVTMENVGSSVTVPTVTTVSTVTKMSQLGASGYPAEQLFLNPAALALRDRIQVS